jgi:hypothetical protein
MFDGTSVNIKYWVPPSQSHRLNVKKLKEIIQYLPDEFVVTIDDMNWIFYEVDWDDGRVDFTRDYKGD